MPPNSNEPAASDQPGTGADAPATPPANDQPAVTPENAQIPEGYELIRTEDKNKIISKRDKATNDNSQLQESFNDLSARQFRLEQETAVNNAVKTSDFKSKYPDVTAEDILDADPSDPDEITKIAEKVQKRLEIVKQNAIKSAQKIDGPPEISPEDKAEELKKLSGPNKPKNAFARALSIDLMKVRKK